MSPCSSLPKRAKNYMQQVDALREGTVDTNNRIWAEWWGSSLLLAGRKKEQRVCSARKVCARILPGIALGRAREVYSCSRCVCEVTMWRDIVRPISLLERTPTQTFLRFVTVNPSPWINWCALFLCSLSLEPPRSGTPTLLGNPQTVIQYVSVIAWVFDFRKFITITDVSLQAMHIACAPIPSFCSQLGITHERLTKYIFHGV